MSTRNLDQQNWDGRYQNLDIPWDAGQITPPILQFFNERKDPSMRILVPGAGLGHEVRHLFRNGYPNVFYCEWSETAARAFLQSCPEFPLDQMLVGDFFQIRDSFDLILEQTFFCALDPVKRLDYVRKCAELLVPSGILAGLLFATPFEQEGPPFGGTEAEYRELFTPAFEIRRLELCHNSLQPRSGNELWFEFRKAIVEV